MSCDLPPLNQLNLPLVYRMFIETDRLGEGIDCLERCMKTIEQPTPLHPIVGRSFMGQLDETTSWLTAFHDKCASGFEPTLMSVEMCEFDINPEEWEVNAFAFSTPLSR